VKRLLLLAVFIATPAFAQDIPHAQQVQPPQFAPITLDEARFNLFVGDMEKVPMPAFAYRQVMQLLQNLETQAQQDKRQAEAKEAPAK
jgi:hypothetical protein